MDQEYNKGDIDDRRRALQGAVDYTKLLTTLATGTVVLTATFLDQFYSGHCIGLLICSWVALALSVAAGLIAIGESIHQLAESTLVVRRGVMETCNLAQWCLLVVGIGLFAVFAILNVTESPGLSIDRDRSGVVRGRGRAVVVCPVEASHGCEGTARFTVMRRLPQKAISLGSAPFVSDRPILLPVVSPRRLSRRALGSMHSGRLRIVVKSGGSQGVDKTVEEIVPAASRRRERCWRQHATGSAKRSDSGHGAHAKRKAPSCRR